VGGYPSSLLFSSLLFPSLLFSSLLFNPLSLSLPPSPPHGTHSAENIGPLVESERERTGESETKRRTGERVGGWVRARARARA